MTKTLGQIAYEAGQAETLRQFSHCAWTTGGPIGWDELEPELKRCHEETAAAIVEECAKVVKDIAQSQRALAKGHYSHEHHSAYMLNQAVESIRSLATPSDARLKSATRDTVGSEDASASLTQNKTEISA